MNEQIVALLVHQAQPGQEAAMGRRQGTGEVGAGAGHVLLVIRIRRQHPVAGEGGIAAIHQPDLGRVRTPQEGEQEGLVVALERHPLESGQVRVGQTVDDRRDDGPRST